MRDRRRIESECLRGLAIQQTGKKTLVSPHEVPLWRNERRAGVEEGYWGLETRGERQGSCKGEEKSVEFGRWKVRWARLTVRT